MAPGRFPPGARLRRPAEFQQALGHGRRLQDSGLTLVIAARESGAARLGLAISARAVPTAAGRNRIKRQARETFRAAQAQLPALDAVLLAQPAAAQAPRAVLRLALQRLWRRAEDACARS